MNNSGAVPISASHQSCVRGRMVLKKLSRKDRLLVKMGALVCKDPAEKLRMLSDYNRVKKEKPDELIGAVNPYLPSTVKPVAETLPVL